MILTPKQIDDLNKVANKLPMQRLCGYAKAGTITLEVLNKLTALNPDRRAELLEIIKEVNGGVIEEPAVEPVVQKEEPPVVQEVEPPVVQKVEPPVVQKVEPPVVQKVEPEVQSETPVQQNNEPKPQPQPCDINAEIAKCTTECAANHTDVYLLGIPSTGKTSILTGLTGSHDIRINTGRGAGPYASVLSRFRDAGITVGQTPSDFIATIEAEIASGGTRHLLNLVEMPVENFAAKIADDENAAVSLEDMGKGATTLLCNANRKALFILVDPTATQIAFNHLATETDKYGNVRKFLFRKNVRQQVVLRRLVALLAQPENKTIMKNVDNIDIIITKADALGSRQQREQAAYKCFMDNYQSILTPLIALCRENGINSKTKGLPMLYTFSLGQFSAAGEYRYDPADADKLVEVLKGNTMPNIQ